VPALHSPVGGGVYFNRFTDRHTVFIKILFSLGVVVYVSKPGLDLAIRVVAHVIFTVGMPVCSSLGLHISQRIILEECFIYFRSFLIKKLYFFFYKGFVQGVYLGNGAVRIRKYLLVEMRFMLGGVHNRE